MSIGKINSACSVEEQVGAWIAAFDKAIANQDESALASILWPDSHWRNLSGVSWLIATFSGADRISHELNERAASVGAASFTVDSHLLRPRENVLANQNVLEALFRFDTRNGPGLGVVRLIPSHTANESPKAWTLATALDIDSFCRTKETTASRRPACTPSASGRLCQSPPEALCSDGELDVLVVGGGHAGLNAAAELKRLGHNVLVLDREERVGDNWRLRYEGLKLHNKTPINHLRYMPFPVTAPDYLPKDKVANWLESYADIMDINFWVKASFEKATYDDENQLWTAEVRHADGIVRDVHPKHIVMANSVSGVPNIPTIDTIENFGGSVLHSSEFTAGNQWAGCSAIVIGTGTSAHDISQALHAQGADVAMVQRSPTLVVDVESAQLYDAIYLGDGPTVAVRDLLNASVPYPVVKAIHKVITRKVKERDASLLDRLENAGFRLDFGEDETGWPLKFRTRGGGYYLNVGCSELIADGDIELIQASAIKQFTGGGLELTDGSARKADLIVLATGYKGLDYSVNSFFGPEVADRVGTIWGLDADYHELRNMWTKTGQPGLWFTGGAFSMCRIYSELLSNLVYTEEARRLSC